MDLFSKSILVAVILVVIIFIGYYALSHASFTQQVSKTEAESLFLHDLQNSNSGADINITNVTPSQYPGSWHIIASVILNATTPCPSYYIYSTDYPKFPSFTYTIDNTYTKNCAIYLSKVGNGYLISSYPVAITDSYLQNLSVVNDFISKYGYNNVVVHAHYYNSTYFYGQDFTNVWLVNYTTTTSRQYVEVLISQENGTSLSTYPQSV